MTPHLVPVILIGLGGGVFVILDDVVGCTNSGDVADVPLATGTRCFVFSVCGVVEHCFLTKDNVEKALQKKSLWLLPVAFMNDACLLSTFGSGHTVGTGDYRGGHPQPHEHRCCCGNSEE